MMDEMVIISGLEKAMVQPRYLTIYYDNKIIRSSRSDISDKLEAKKSPYLGRIGGWRSFKIIK